MKAKVALAGVWTAAAVCAFGGYLDEVEAQFARTKASIPAVTAAAEAARARIDAHPYAAFDLPGDLAFGVREEMIGRAGGLAQIGYYRQTPFNVVLLAVRSWEDFGPRAAEMIAGWRREGRIVVAFASAAGRPAGAEPDFLVDNFAPDGRAAHGAKNVLVNAGLAWMFCCEYAAAHSRTGKFPAVIKSVGPTDASIVNAHIGSPDGAHRFFPCAEEIPAGELAKVYWNQGMLRFRYLREPHVRDGIAKAAEVVADALVEGRRVAVAGLGHLILEEPKHGLKSPMMGLRAVSMMPQAMRYALDSGDVLVWIAYTGVSTRWMDYSQPMHAAHVRLVASYAQTTPYREQPPSEAFIEQPWCVPDAEVAIPVPPGYMGTLSEFDRVVVLRELDEAVAARLAAKGARPAPSTPFDPYLYYDYAMENPRELPGIWPAANWKEPKGPHRRFCGSGDQRLFCDDDFHWGAMKADGTTLVPAEYATLDGWRGGELLRAEKDGKFGVIDWSGRVVVPFEWEMLGGGSSWCAAAKGGRYGVMDMKTFRLITPCRYDFTPERFGRDLVRGTLDGKQGAFTPDGRTVVAPEWDYVRELRGVECIVQRDARRRLVTTDGSEPKVRGVHDDVEFLPDGGYRILDDRRYGLLNADGSVRVAQNYDHIELDAPKARRALGRRGGKWYLLAARDAAADWSETEIPGGWEFVAFSGAPDALRVAKDMKWGLMDFAGKMLAPAEYGYVHRIRSGGFRAAKGGEWSRTAREFPTLVGARWGFLDVHGRERGEFRPVSDWRAMIP